MLIGWLLFSRHEAHRTFYRNKLYILQNKFTVVQSPTFWANEQSHASKTTTWPSMEIYFFTILYQDQAATLQHEFYSLQDWMVDGCISKCITLIGKTWANLKKRWVSSRQIWKYFCKFLKCLNPQNLPNHLYLKNQPIVCWGVKLLKLPSFHRVGGTSKMNLSLRLVGEKNAFSSYSIFKRKTDRIYTVYT